MCPVRSAEKIQIIIQILNYIQPFWSDSWKTVIKQMVLCCQTIAPAQMDRSRRKSVK